MIYILYQNHQFQPQIEYTFKVIMSVYGIEWRIASYDSTGTLQNQPNDILISYGKEKPAIGFPKHIHICESGLLGEDYLKPASLPATPLAKFRGDLPIIYCGKKNTAGTAHATAEYRAIETECDIIASSFFMLTRYEEVLQDKNDEHGRFPARESLAYREGFLDRPIINEYIELLWSWIQELAPDLPRKPLWPDGKPSAVCLTHDVDVVQKYASPPLVEITHLLLRERRPLQALWVFWDYLAVLLHWKSDPFDTFDYLLNLEQKLGIRSSFYFMTAGKSATVPYAAASRRVRRLMERIESAGGEVGLHASYNTITNLVQLESEKERLDQLVKVKSYGCRQHYLRCRVPDTWRIQSRAGLLYDTTMSFADYAGFRCGFCLPFHPFDLLENRELNIWELPLIVMDSSLHDPAYQGLPPQEALAQITQYIEATKKHGGVFVILWHNSAFDPLMGWGRWQGVYEQALAYIDTQNAFSGNGREIIEYWQRRITD